MADRSAAKESPSAIASFYIYDFDLVSHAQSVSVASLPSPSSPSATNSTTSALSRWPTSLPTPSQTGGQRST
eukprot:7037003-Pyramimonas_sp.AAC.1